eukprot:TRINITY_DN43365_c0_g1_i1.p1 TRINITY_DN43365_c0_g1~~TRINITY_DN43365_c0_g1_i1.p1  ORF type:complete len:163 (+),score=36.08 TRINITY_DN43365_c0_g1_i1:44-532(+)
MGSEASRCCRCDDQADDEIRTTLKHKPESGGVPGLPTSGIPSMSEDVQQAKYTSQAPSMMESMHGLQPKVEEFNVTIIKEKAKKFGIDIDLSDGKTLLIESISEAGLIADWNKTIAQDRGKKYEVREQDRIVIVNGISGDSQALADICVQDDRLELTIRRTQ